MHSSGTEPLSVILSQRKWLKCWKVMTQKSQNKLKLLSSVSKTILFVKKCNLLKSVFHIDAKQVYKNKHRLKFKWSLHNNLKMMYIVRTFNDKAYTSPHLLRYFFNFRIFIKFFIYEVKKPSKF